MPGEQLSTEGDHKYRAGENDYAQLKAEQEAGLNQVTDSATAHEIAHAAKDPVESNIALAQAAEADAARLRESSAAPESQGAPLSQIEQVAANVATGQVDASMDRAGFQSLAAGAHERTAAAHRDKAAIELNYAERNLTDGETVAAKARTIDESEARDRAIDRAQAARDKIRLKQKEAGSAAEAESPDTQITDEPPAETNQAEMDPAKARDYEIAHIAKDAVEEKIAAAQAAEAAADKAMAESKETRLQGGTLPDLVQETADLVTGQEGSITDHAGLRLLGAQAKAREAAKLRDEAGMAINHAERVHDIGEEAANEHPGKLADEREVSARAIDRMHQDKIDLAQAKLDRDQAALDSLGMFSFRKRPKLEAEIAADHETLKRLKEQQEVDRNLNDQVRGISETNTENTQG